MPRCNGGLLGSLRTAGTSGTWGLEEQVVYQRNGTWERDPNFSDVSLLLHMDGSNGSTTFTDSSKNVFAVTVSGNSKISTAQSKFGGASALFDGSGDYLSIPYNSAFNFAGGDFTIELWAYLTSVPTDPVFFLHRPSVAARGILFSASTNRAVYCLAGDSNTSGWEVNFSSANGVFALNNWHNFALSRSGSTWRIFVDGTIVATATWNGVIDDSSGTIILGANDSGTSNFINGYIDELRITKGIARWNADFTPPAEPFPNI